jgi:hypothetical protein
MSQNPEIDPDASWNAEIDPSDPAIAWNFGTRELTDDEYQRFAAAHHRDFDRWAASQEADEAYAAWKKANPQAAAEAEAAAEADSRARFPLLWGEATPEMEQAVHEAGGWFGYEADAREPKAEPELNPEAEAAAEREIEDPEAEID